MDLICACGQSTAAGLLESGIKKAQVVSKTLNQGKAPRPKAWLPCPPISIVSPPEMKGPEQEIARGQSRLGGGGRGGL